MTQPTNATNAANTLDDLGARFIALAEVQIDGGTASMVKLQYDLMSRLPAASLKDAMSKLTKVVTPVEVSYDFEVYNCDNGTTGTNIELTLSSGDHAITLTGESDCDDPLNAAEQDDIFGIAQALGFAPQGTVSEDDMGEWFDDTDGGYKQMQGALMSLHDYGWYYYKHQRESAPAIEIAPSIDAAIEEVADA